MRLGRGTVVLVEWGDRSDRITEASDVVIELRITGEDERLLTARCDPQFAYVFED